jgi:uncharacterized protein involved in exopolysaccharide biosynthesis
MGNKLEIDIIDFFKILLSKKKLIIRIILITGIIGALISLLLKKEFEAGCKLMPEVESNQSKGLGNLGGLAGLVGIKASDLGTSSNTLNPEIYPIIVRSIPFKDQLLNKSFYFRKYNESYTGYEYFDEIYSPSIIDYILKLPNYIRKLFKPKKISLSNKSEDSNVWTISYRQKVIFDIIDSRINVNVDVESGLVSIKSKMPDPVAAAEVASAAVELLTKHVIDYKISKARVNLEFIESQYLEKKKEYESAQQKLAVFEDNNRNVVTSLAKTERQKLQYEYDLSYEIYKSLTQQLEQSKIKVKEDTPVFTIIEPIVIPIQKSEPGRIFITLTFMLLGFLGSILIIFGRYYLNLRSNRLVEDDPTE